MDNLAEEKLFSIVQDKIGDRLVEVTLSGAFDETISVSSMAKAGRRVVFSYGKHKVEEKDTPVKSEFNWRRGCFNTPWPDSSDASKMMRTLDNELKNNLSFQKHRVNGLSFTLTPEVGDIIQDLFQRIFCFFYRSKGIQSMAGEIEGKITSFIEERAQVIKANVSVISTDFPSKKLVAQVIELNSLQEALKKI